MDTKAYCTQGRDQECSEENCCMKDKLSLTRKLMDDYAINKINESLSKLPIFNWGISCEK